MSRLRIKGRLRLLEAYFLALMLGLSFLPLARLNYVWDGYGPFGTYVYNTEAYQLVFNGPGSGSGAQRPLIYLWEMGVFKVPLVEVSDQASLVDGKSIYTSFNLSLRQVGEGLVATYRGGGVCFNKSVEADGRCVHVSFSFNEARVLTLTLWRYYFDSFQNVTKHTLHLLKPNASSRVVFSFKQDGGTYWAEVLFSSRPRSISLAGDEDGIYKATLVFNVSRLDLEVKALGSTGPVNIARLLLGSALTYPLLASAFTCLYVGVRVCGPRFKIRVARRPS